MILPNALLRFSGIAAGVMFANTGRETAECDSTIIAERATQFASRLPDLSPHYQRIYLIRHGQTEWNKQGLMQGGGYDIPLNENGLSQAAYAAEELSAIPLDVIASSHLQRAHQTADVIHSSQPSATRLVFSEFGEMRFGEFEGYAIRGPQATEDKMKRFQIMNEQMADDSEQEWPDGESTRQVEVRSRKALYEIMKKHEDSKHIAIVAHGRTNKILLASLLLNDLSQFRTIKQGNTCINIIDFEKKDERWCTVLLNYIDHTEDRGAGSGGTL